MKAITLLAILVVGAFCSNIHQQMMRDLFNQWKVNHNKLYTAGHEEEYRFNIFAQNYLDIVAFNAQGESANLALNQFADLSSAEFGALHTGYLARSKTQSRIHVFDTTQDPPASVDWRTKGAVTPVKNQGSCGSCWAFSATGALEGLYFLDNNNLLSFSEQNLVDCVTADQGCGGGLPDDAFAYTAQDGIQTEQDYPYTGVDGTCSFDKSKAVKVNSAYQDVTPKSLDQMKAAIVNQPVSVGIQANQLVFQFYNGGVIKRLCGDSLDHGVLVVGYDNIKGDDAFIVKNSWGASWGNAGYVYISTDASANSGNGVCGILSAPSVPTK